MAAALKIRVVPNAKRSEIAGAYGEAVKVKVAAPAVEGKANAALLEFLAECLDLPTRALTLVSGEKSRDKLIALNGLTAEEAKAKLLETERS